MIRTIIVILLCICMLGCTSMQAVEGPVLAEPTQLSTGDSVQVTTKAGRSYELTVTELSNDAITGQDDDGKLWKVPFDQVRSLEIERFNTAKTAGATAAGLSLTAIVLIVLGTIAFGKAIESGGD